MTVDTKNRKKALANTIRQKVWNYMRRNRTFTVGDIMAITGANYKNLREMLKVYEHTGYIKILSREAGFTTTRCRLVKCTGVKAPSHDKDKGTLYDYNTEEEIIIQSLSSFEKVLNCLNKSLISKEEINKTSGLSEATMQKVYAELKKSGIMTRVTPTVRNSFGHRLFSVDLQKVKEHQEELVNERANVISEKLKAKKQKASETQKTQKVSDTLIMLLSSMTKNKMSRRGLDEAAGLTIGTSKNYWERLIKRGVISEIKPTQKEGKRVLFKIYPKKAAELKQLLLDGEEL